MTALMHQESAAAVALPLPPGLFLKALNTVFLPKWLCRAQGSNLEWPATLTYLKAVKDELCRMLNIRGIRKGTPVKSLFTPIRQGGWGLVCPIRAFVSRFADALVRTSALPGPLHHHRWLRPATHWHKCHPVRRFRTIMETTGARTWWTQAGPTRPLEAHFDPRFATPFAEPHEVFFDGSYDATKTAPQPP